MTHPHESLAGQFLRGDGALVVGDVGFVVLKALLENGVGYLVTGFHERSNVLDSAIADIHESILARRGVLLRRMRDGGRLETLLQGGVRAGTPIRGAVVWAGDTGMTGPLADFVALEVGSPVVGFCFDPDAVGIADAVVFDPEPTPRGVVRAIDEAFAASHAMGRPALVLLRERTIAMRGTLLCRDNLAPDAAVALAGAVDETLSPADAVAAVDPNDVTHAGARLAIVCSAAAAMVVRRAVAEIGARLMQLAPDVGLSPESITVLSVAVPSIAIDSELAVATGAASDVLALVPRAACDTWLQALGATSRVSAVTLGNAVNELDVFDAVADWLRECVPYDDIEAASRFEAALAAARPGGSPLGTAIKAQLPPRGAVITAEFPPLLAACLTLAQAEIGVPARIDPTSRTYQCETGAMLTIASADEFIARGAACAAPAGQHGVFVVLASAEQATTVSGAASAAGITAQLVDGAQPLDAARAIATACRTPYSAAQVLVVAPLTAPAVIQGIAGYDLDLMGSDRLAASVLDEHTLAIVDGATELQSSPRLALATPGSTIDPRRAGMLSPSWYRVRVASRTSAIGRMRRSSRTSVLRSLLRMES